MDRQAVDLQATGILLDRLAVEGLKAEPRGVGVAQEVAVVVIAVHSISTIFYSE